MFKPVALYNKSDGATSVRIGNWVEEKALKKYDTGNSVFQGATYERCIAHKDTQDYTKLRSLNTETFSRQALKGSVPLQVGPRAARREQALMRRAQAETEEKKVDRSFFETEPERLRARPAFISEVGRRVMKTQVGQPIPVEAGVKTFVEHGSQSQRAPFAGRDQQHCAQG